MNSAKSFT